jgi:hypothetical protein
MNLLQNIWNFIYTHLEWLMLWSFVIFHYKTLFNALFLEPIRGGNGVTQTNELAQWAVIALLVYCIIVEGQDEKTYIDQGVIWALVIGVLSLAGVKHISTISKHF